MSPGVIAFLTVLSVLTVFYAIFGSTAPTVRKALDGTEMPAPGKKGLFEQLVRPVLNNLLPQAPQALTDYAKSNGQIAALLARSGNPWRVSPEEYLLVRGLSLIGGTAGLVLLAVIGYLPIPVIEALPLGLLVGFLTPKVLLDSAWKKRRRDLDAAMPEALDLIRICMNAGYNFQNALTQTVILLPPGTTKDEMGRVAAELRAGRTVDTALTMMARRCPTDTVDAFVRAISQAQSTGSDIATTLAYQSADARAEYERQIDVKAQKMQTYLFFPIIALLLPALMIFMFGPTTAALGQL